jgi:predicted TIM-barrel fold metal-dependent hydrolase
VHVVGLGVGGTGAFINPRMTSLLHPVDSFKYEIYRSASGIENDERADREYIERLVALARTQPVPPKLSIMAFDKHHLDDGSVSLDHTEFFVPNEYVFALVDEFPDVLQPVISVHPYRADAVEALDKWAKRGGRFVKWLPNAMNIDPAAARNDAYYAKMKEHGLVLISHAGEEQAVDAEEAQRLGNPLRLRRPLDAGVRVVVAHCASLGEGEDLDAADPATAPKVLNFELFLRLMKEERYVGLLFGEISATLQFNRLPGPVNSLLTTPELHGRLINGSDYPLPAINALVRTGDVLDAGLITESERGLLDEIYDYNPLLYDFVMKRTIKGPDGQRIPNTVFLAHPGLVALAPSAPDPSPGAPAEAGAP